MNGTMKNITTVLLFFSSFCFAQTKTEVAKEEPVHVKESNVLWAAAVSDTMKLCVINANSVAVMNASFPMEKNITRQISFKVKNEKGEGRTVNAVVKGIATWNGKKCYTVELELGMNFMTHMVNRKVECVLADLEEAPYKLYVGANWLGDDMELKP
jgi:hypothetical protein